MGAVFDLKIPSTEKLVLLAMADHAREDGTGCYPSINRLAKKTSLSKRGTQKIVHRLVAAGLVKDTGKISRYQTIEYTITLDKGGEQGSLVFRAKGANARTKRSEHDCAKGANLSAQTSEPGSPESLGTKDLIKNRTGRAISDRRQDAKASTAKTDDDDSRAPLPSPQEKQDAAEQYSHRVDEFREAILRKFRGRADDEFLNGALDVIDQRAWNRQTRIASANFFEISLENFLQDERKVADLKEQLGQRRAWRDRWMPGFNEKDHSAESDPTFRQDVLFAVEESQRTGRVANEILQERRAARAHAETRS
jgi:hypothetical protein